jgi:hypothetical protein
MIYENIDCFNKYNIKSKIKNLEEQNKIAKAKTIKKK